MNSERLSIAVVALNKHTGKEYLLHRDLGLFSVRCTVGGTVTTTLAAKTRKQLFDGICYYIQGYHAGRRSCT